jgi:hypothetical protein
LRDVKGFGGGRLFAKNMNPRQRAQALWEKYNSLPGCKILELDASRFDAHVNEAVLRWVEHLFWERTCLGPQIRELLEWQRSNSGHFRVDDFVQWYRVKGGRMSGDANTAAGNCIIMACLLAAFGQWLITTNKAREFTFLCDGDDSVFFYLGDVVTDAHVDEFFRQFGFTMKIENRPDRFEDINFCQSKPVFIDGGYTMIRDPRKILSKLGVTPKIRQPKGRLKYIRTVALGELSLCRGCPVVQEYLRRVVEVCTSAMTTQQKQRGMIHKMAIHDYYRLRQYLPGDWQSGRTLPVTPSARESFQRAWGIGVNEQVRLEGAFERWVFDLAKTQAGDGFDVGKWMPPVFRRERW